MSSARRPGAILLPDLEFCFFLEQLDQIGEFRSMSFSTIAWISFGETGWLALALVASETSSLLQLGQQHLAARAADVMSARTSAR